MQPPGVCAGHRRVGLCRDPCQAREGGSDHDTPTTDRCLWSAREHRPGPVRGSSHRPPPLRPEGSTTRHHTASTFPAPTSTETADPGIRSAPADPLPTGLAELELMVLQVLHSRIWCQLEHEYLTTADGPHPVTLDRRNDLVAELSTRQDFRSTDPGLWAHPGPGSRRVARGATEAPGRPAVGARLLTGGSPVPAPGRRTPPWCRPRTHPAPWLPQVSASPAPGRGGEGAGTCRCSRWHAPRPGAADDEPVRVRVVGHPHALQGSLEAVLKGAHPGGVAHNHGQPIGQVRVPPVGAAVPLLS